MGTHLNYLNKFKKAYVVGTHLNCLNIWLIFIFAMFYSRNSCT